jgi:general secretion pathway protein K
MRSPRSSYQRLAAVTGARQSGAALIVAMLVFALSVSLVVAMQSEFYRYFQRTTNLLLAEQARAYLLGAEDLAALALQQDYDQDVRAQRARDDLTEFWAQQSQPLPLDDIGWLRAEPIVDLQGRFNLNWLDEKPPQGKRFTPAQQQFVRLLQALPGVEVSEFEAVAITEAVIDWIDVDGTVLADGAEDDYYAAIAPGYRVANRPMSSVSELRAVANVTPEIYAVLQHLVTVWPQQPEPLNIHTAPEILLRSINADDDLTPLSEADGQTLVEQRQELGFADKQEFGKNPVFNGKSVSGAMALLGESSSYFMLHAWVELADRNMHLYSVLERRDRRVRTIARAGGSLQGASL